LTSLPPDPAEPSLSELRLRLDEEDRIYGELLAKLDRLSENPSPYETDPGLPGLLAELNEAAALAPPEQERSGGGLKGLARTWVTRLVSPELARIERALERQREFDSVLVQFLNRFSERTNSALAKSAELASALVGFAQRIDRLADAKDRLYASLGNRRSDLLLEAMDKRLETVRLGIAKAQERLEGMSTAVALSRAEVGVLLSGKGGAADPKPPARERLDEARYLAFEERFRGSSEDIRGKLRDYVPLFREKGPVLDLGCGRGEFLELLGEAGIEGLGVDGNREMVRACRERELRAETADVLVFVSERPPGSAGGIFAAQLIEHLPARDIGDFLDDCYRALRPEGRLVLETVNPRSLTALVESFYRDLTHEKPLHPETLDFALRAAGFREVETRYSSPVPERARLLPLAGPDPRADSERRTLNQNFEKLNRFLFGELDYAAIATK
jgi:O-antigen chain-terminating methyltransferase